MGERPVQFTGTLDTLEETEEYLKKLSDESVEKWDALVNSFPEDQKEELKEKLQDFQWVYRTLCEVRDRYYMWQEGYTYQKIEDTDVHS